MGLVRAEDAETGEQCWVDSGNPPLLARYAELMAVFDETFPRGLERVEDGLNLPSGPPRPRGRVEEGPAQEARDLFYRPGFK